MVPIVGVEGRDINAGVCIIIGNVSSPSLGPILLLTTYHCQIGDSNIPEGCLCIICNTCIE